MVLKEDSGIDGIHGCGGQDALSTAAAATMIRDSGKRKCEGGSALEDGVETGPEK